jgi:predicted ATP-binding protein involved in virulence
MNAQEMFPHARIEHNEVGDIVLYLDDTLRVAVIHEDDDDTDPTVVVWGKDDGSEVLAIVHLADKIELPRPIGGDS